MIIIRLYSVVLMFATGGGGGDDDDDGYTYQTLKNYLCLCVVWVMDRNDRIMLLP